MPNPQDEPGHRPPSPRPGEPSPYQGGPPPPQYHQGPPPQHQQWQQPPPGYGPPPQEAPPGYGPPPQAGGPQFGYTPQKGKGFVGALFDTNFDEMVTTRLIKVAYALAIVVYSLIALLMLLFAWSFFAWSDLLGLITLVATPFVWLAGLLTTRLILEFVINQFKITEHLKAIKEKGEGLR